MPQKTIYIHAFILSILLFGCTSFKEGSKSAVVNVLEKINGEPVVPRNANSIYILPFFNSTDNIAIPGKLSINIKKSICMDGRLVVVSEKDKADLKLEGIITAYQIQPIKYGELNRPVMKRMRIIASVKLFDLRLKKIILYEAGIQSFETYSDTIPPIKTKTQILNSVIENLAKRISSKVITGWYTDHMTHIEKGKK